MHEELFLIKKRESFKRKTREDAILSFSESLKYEVGGYQGVIKKDTNDDRFWIDDKLYQVAWKAASISYRTTVNGYWYFYRVVRDCNTEVK